MSDSYYAPPPAQAPTSGMAIASLVASILGLTFIPVLGGIAGVILGYVARNQIRESGGAVGGEGLAKAGLIIGWVGIGLFVTACTIVVILSALGPAIGGVFSDIASDLGNSY